MVARIASQANPTKTTSVMIRPMHPPPGARERSFCTSMQIVEGIDVEREWPYSSRLGGSTKVCVMVNSTPVSS